MLDGFLCIGEVDFLVGDTIELGEVDGNPGIAEGNRRRFNLYVFAFDKQVLGVLLDVVIKNIEATISLANLNMVARNAFHRQNVLANASNRLVEKFDATHILLLRDLLNEEVGSSLHIDMVILHLYRIVAIVVERLTAIDVLRVVTGHVGAQHVIETILTKVAPPYVVTSDERVLFHYWS